MLQTVYVVRYRDEMDSDLVGIYDEIEDAELAVGRYLENVKPYNVDAVEIEEWRINEFFNDRRHRIAQIATDLL